MPHIESPHIYRDGNRINIGGPLRISEFYPLLATIYDTIHNRGYEELALDFEPCTAAFPGPMLAVCSQVMDLRSKGVETELILPKDPNLATLFRNTNWAYFLDPTRQQKSRFKGFKHVPVTQFTSAIEQNDAVNTIADALLVSMSNFTRADFDAIEWSLNEITDNVLTHAHSAIGGIMQLTAFERKKRRVEFAVCDAGIGIPVSLRDTHSEITSDIRALERAVREGVTRDKAIGQGNGLFGTWQICRISGGYFQIHSGHAFLDADVRGLLNIRNIPVPYAGTLVIACIDLSRPGVLREALKFGGVTDSPVDYIETKYESTDGKTLVFSMRNETDSLGSRLAAVPVRVKLKNISLMCQGQKIQIDFADIPLISSSFADEVFGKLFVELGPLRFMQNFEFLNITKTIRELIDRAIAQRNATGL